MGRNGITEGRNVVVLQLTRSAVRAEAASILDWYHNETKQVSLEVLFIVTNGAKLIHFCCPLSTPTTVLVPYATVLSLKQWGSQWKALEVLTCYSVLEGIEILTAVSRASLCWR